MVHNAKRLARKMRSLAPALARERLGRFLTADLEDVYFPSIKLALRTLRHLGLEPKFCVDVGAYRGDWSRLFRSVFPSSRVLMIEPQAAKREQLIAAQQELGEGVSYVDALLGSEGGKEVTFHEMETGSSVFAESSHFPRMATKKTTQTLDTVLAGAGGPGPDFVKLDVQGYELEVLKGATRTLLGVEAVLMEVSLLPVNQGCPSFAEVVGFMEERRFRLFDFCSQVRRTDGVLWQTDLLFLRAGSRIAPKPELTPETWR